MSKESLEQFLNQVAQSEELQTRIGEAIEIDELIALGAEHGCEFSAKDLAENAELSDAENAELSDKELDGVAGGGRREDRQTRRAIKRMVRAAKKVDGAIGDDGRILWDTKGPGGTGDPPSTEYWDDGTTYPGDN